MQKIYIYADPFKFHIGQYFDQRVLYFFENAYHLFLFQKRIELVFELQCDVCIFAGIFFYFLGLHVAHVALVLAFLSNQIDQVDGFITQVFFTKGIHPVFSIGFDHVVRQHGIEDGSGNFNAQPFQYEQIVFAVLSYPFLLYILKQRLKLMNPCSGLFGISRTGNIPGGSRLNGETQSNQFSLIGVNTRCFGIKADFIVFLQFGDQCLNACIGIDQLILVWSIVYVPIGNAVYFCIGLGVFF